MLTSPPILFTVVVRELTLSSILFTVVVRELRLSLRVLTSVSILSSRTGI